MLLEDRGVLDRHQPAAELDEPGAERDVAVDGAGVCAGRLRLGHEASPATPSAAPATSSAARRTSARSVSKVRIVGASSKGIQRTSLELVVVVGQVAAGRLHQEVVDGLVDARPGLDEEVLDRVERAGDPDLQAGLLGHLAEGGLLGRLAALGRALREGPGPAVALATATADDELRLSGLVTDDDPAGGRGGRGPQPRHGAEAALGRRVAAGPRGAGPAHHDRVTRATSRWTRGRPAGSTRQRPRRLRQRRHVGAAQDGRAWSTAGRKAAAETSPSRRSRARADGTDELGRRPGRVLGGDAVVHRAQWYRFSPALQGRHARASARSGASVPRATRQVDLPLGRGAVQRQHARGVRRASAARCASSVPRSPRAIGPVSAAADPERPGVAERPLDERAVDRERAGLVQAGHAAQRRRWRRAARRTRRPRGRPPRDRRPSSPAPGGPGGRRAPRPCRPAAPTSWSSRLDRDRGAVERGDRPLGVGEGDQRMERADLGAGRHAPAPGRRHRARRWCGPSPARCTSGSPRRAARWRRRGRRR